LLCVHRLLFKQTLALQYIFAHVSHRECSSINMRSSTKYVDLQFINSTFIDQTKFNQHHQRQKLSNSVDPTTFKPVTTSVDYSRFVGSTQKHPPEHVGGPATVSIVFDKAEVPVNWNASTKCSHRENCEATTRLDEVLMYPEQ